MTAYPNYVRRCLVIDVFAADVVKALFCFLGGSINFNALDALKMVSADTLPDVQVCNYSASFTLEQVLSLGFYPKPGYPVGFAVRSCCIFE